MGEIEHLKSTLKLLLQIMTFARLTYLALGKDNDMRYAIRAEQALYEQFNASERLVMLRKQQTEEEKGEGAATSSRGTLVSYNDPVLSAFQHQYLTSDASSNDTAARIRADSPLWLAQMKAEWFDGEEPKRHLGWQLVKEDPQSFSDNRKQHEPKTRDEYERKIRDKYEEKIKELQRVIKVKLQKSE